jgi:hypothetical protein
VVSQYRSFVKARGSHYGEYGEAHVMRGLADWGHFLRLGRPICFGRIRDLNHEYTIAIENECDIELSKI